MKPKVSKQTVRTNLTDITRRNWVQKIWDDKGREFAGEFTSFCKAEGMQIYTTLSETKALFTERTKWSTKNRLYRYVEDSGFNQNLKLTQFVTILNCTRKFLLDLKAKNIRSSDFLSFLYSTPPREFRTPKSKNWHKVGISKYDQPCRK